MPFNLVWSTQPGFFCARSHGLHFRLNQFEQNRVDLGVPVSSILTQAIRLIPRGDLVLSGPPLTYTAVSVDDHFVRVRHEGFKTRTTLFAARDTEPEIEAKSSWCGKQFVIVPGALKLDIYIASREAAASTGAPLPPLVPGYVWVRRSDLEALLDADSEVQAKSQPPTLIPRVTLVGLDSPEDLAFRVLGQPPLVQYALELRQWARAKRNPQNNVFSSL